MARRGDEQSSRTSRAADPLARSDLFTEAEGQTDYLCADLPHGRLLVRADNDRTGRALFVDGGHHDIDVLARVVSTLRVLYGADANDARTLIHVGAGSGVITVSALLSDAFGDAVALEPDPQDHLTLRLNLVLNTIEDRVTALPVAVSNVDGTIELDAAKVQSVTLDGLAAQRLYDLDRPGLLWIDGCDAGAVLEGAGRLTGRGVPVLMRWPPDGPSQHGIFDQLQQLAGGSYTHIATLEADSDGRSGDEPLTVSRLRDLTVGQHILTHVLVLRVPDGDVSAGTNRS